MRFRAYPFLAHVAGVAIAWSAATHALAGGPISIVNQKPVVYSNGGANIVLDLDQGPLGARSNAQAVALVQAAVGLWNGVSTSTARLVIGTPLFTDYTTANYLNIYRNYSDGINPVIFDTDGSITDDLLGVGQKSHVLGFAGSAYYTSGPQAGKFAEGDAILNGYLSTSDATFTNVIAHELGHFIGLDHSQLDSTQGLAQSNYVLMYPIAYRTVVSLHEDDIAAVTALYPTAGVGGAYGQLTGTFVTPGGTPILGANLWALESSGKVYSVVSDFLTQGTGYFRMYLPPGTYTLHAEPIQSSFTGGSSVGPYANSSSDLSFQPPNPVTPVALGGGAMQSIVITAGCVATATFRSDGTGSVGGNCGAPGSSGMPGNGTVSANPYGPLSVQGATLVGSTISALQANAVVQLGTTAGAPGSFAEIDFQGLGIAAGNTLTLRSGAAGQTVALTNAGSSASTIGGLLQAQGSNGAPAPAILLRDAKGLTVAAGGSVIAPGGLDASTLGSSVASGQPLVNNGAMDGGTTLTLRAAKVSGGGTFKGNAIVLSTFGNANNPVNGLHFLGNGLQLAPSTGTDVALTVNDYGAAPQVLNVLVKGNATISLPSSLPAALGLPANNLPLLPGAVRPAGVADPAYGGGSIIVQSSGTMSLQAGASGDFAFPGSVVFKAGGGFDAKGVSIDNAWTATGQSFQGVFFEAPSISNSAGTLQVYTDNLNWVNFSVLPNAHVRTFELVRQGDGSAQFQGADSVAPHLNTYSVLIDANAAGQCYVCLVNSAVINVQ